MPDKYTERKIRTLYDGSVNLSQKYDPSKPIESPCHNKGYDQSLALSKILTPCTVHKELPESLYRRNTSVSFMNFLSSNDST